jgi:hypothetical protein
MSTGLFANEEDGYTLEETKYTLKVDAPASEPVSEPDSSDSDFGFGDDSEDESFGGEDEPKDDKPFDDEPFDAGVEADEDEDPKKYIQQLAGKIGQSLRDYEKDLDNPDFELEKFVINSVISATNTSEMDKEDQEDIIKKVETSGSNNEPKDDEKDTSEPAEDNGDEIDVDVDVKDEESLDEISLGDDIEGVFQEWSKPMHLKDAVIVSDGLKYHLDGKIPLGESVFRYGSEKYINLLKEVKSLYDSNLISLNENDEFIVNSAIPKVAIVDDKEILLNTIYEDVDEDLSFINEIDDVVEHLPTFTQLAALGAPMLALIIRDIIKGNKKDAEEKLEKGLKDEKDNNELSESMIDDLSKLLKEAEYRGKKVKLNKPKRGGSKKFYVYVRDPKTKNIKKVSFGAKSGGGNLAVKLKDPKARKAFADRHNCEQKNDKTKAGYWACRLPRYAKSLGLSGGGTWW